MTRMFLLCSLSNIFISSSILFKRVPYIQTCALTPSVVSLPCSHLALVSPFSSVFPDFSVICIKAISYTDMEFSITSSLSSFPEFPRDGLIGFVSSFFPDGNLSSFPSVYVILY